MIAVKNVHGARPSQRAIGSLVFESVAIVAVVAGDGIAWKLLVLLRAMELRGNFSYRES